MRKVHNVNSFAHRRARTRRTGVAAAALSAALLATACGGTASGDGVQHAGGPQAPAAVVAADKDFYNGKTVTWDVFVKPGAGEYTEASILAPVVADYLHATVNIVSLPAGTGIPGEDKLAVSKPDGLTIGSVKAKDIIFAGVDKAPTVNFQISDQVPVCGFPQNLQALTVAPNAPWKTFADMVKSGGPGTAVGYQGNAAVLDEQKILFATYGVHIDFRTGYESSNDATAGFLRGDAQILFGGITNIGSVITSGKALPVLLSYKPAPGSIGYDQLKNIPTFDEVATGSPPADANAAKAAKLLGVMYDASAFSAILLAPRGTPPARQSALNEAVTFAMKQPAVLAALQKAGQTSGCIAPADVSSQLADIIANTQLLASYTK